MKEVINLDFNGLLYAVRKEDWEKISADNWEIIKNYDKDNKNSSLSDNSRCNNIQYLISFGKIVKKPFNEITSEDISKYYDGLEVNNTTRANYTINLRKFFKWLYQDENPECIKNVKKVKVKQNNLKFSDMLTEGEIQKLIDSIPDSQHKAVIAVLYDSACRVGELVGLKRKDVSCNNGQWIISVSGKTGVRNIPLTLSVIYFEPWFNRYHTAKHNDEAPLFVSMCPRNLYDKIENRHLSRNGIWEILDQAKRATGITKNIHPHILRHSRLTWLADHGMPENMMRVYAGWTNGSNMVSVYIHTNPVAVVNKINELQNGKPPEQIEPVKSKLLPRECPRCHVDNEQSSPYCKKCWLPLSIKASMTETIMIDVFRTELFKHENEIAKETGEYLDIEKLSQKYQQLLQEENQMKTSGRKQLPVVKTSP